MRRRVGLDIVTIPRFRLFRIILRHLAQCILLQYSLPSNIVCCFQIFGHFLAFLAFLWQFWLFFGGFGCLVAFLAFLWFFVAFLYFSRLKIAQCWRKSPGFHLEIPEACSTTAVPP